MEDKEKMVEVTTTVDRMYRAKPEDTVAVTVKAGVPTMVPLWVVKEWEPKPQGAPATPQGAPDEALKAANARIAELEAELARWKQPQTASQGHQQTQTKAPAVPKKG